MFGKKGPNDVEQQAERNLVFAVYDDKAQAYGKLIVDSSLGTAIRSFTAACQNPETHLAQFSSDFALYHLGNYDERTGRVHCFNEPRFVIRASDIVPSKTSIQPAEVSNA